MLKDTVYKITGTAIAAIAGAAVVLVLPKEIAAVVTAGVAGFAVWKYVVVKEIKRIADQAQAAATAAQAVIAKAEAEAQKAVK